MMGDLRFRVENVIGSGGGGIVYRAMDLADPSAVKLVALKEPKTVDNEIELMWEKHIGDRLRSIGDDNLVVIKEITIMNSKRIGVSMLCEKTLSALKGKIGLLEASVRFIELINALQKIHSAGVVHCDIKCDNVLIDYAGKLKLNDYGHSTFIWIDDHGNRYVRCAQGLGDHKYTKEDQWFRGTIAYMAAAVHHCYPPNPVYDLESAVYSFIDLMGYELPWDRQSRVLSRLLSLCDTSAAKTVNDEISQQKQKFNPMFLPGNFFAS
ncbi:kinase-like domain-containing protein [Paraphysoderma sedebokerense]|nr:kinase-like domain-containing protein [Paraphysoderma sedebokerense]